MTSIKDMEAKQLTNRMTGESRTVRSPEDVRAAYPELADPWRSLRVAVRNWSRRRFGRLFGQPRNERDERAR